MADFPLTQAAKPRLRRFHGALALLGLATVAFAAGTALSAAPAPRESSTTAKSRASRGPGAETTARRAGQASARERGRSDSAVVTAGGVVAAGGAVRSDGTASSGRVVQATALATADCSHCGRRGCNHCRPAGGRLGLACNGRCDAGGCPAHCPVRPDQFGYYATRWRSWPGQGVRQASHFDPATTPSLPPRSQLPTLDEESGIEEGDDAGNGEEENEEADTTSADSSDAASAGQAESDVPTADSMPGPADEPAPAETDRPGERSAEPNDDPLEKLLERPKAGDGASGRGSVPRGTRAPAAFTDAGSRPNPLRGGGAGWSEGSERAAEANVSTAYVGGDAPVAPRGAPNGWRSLQRGPARDAGAAASLRGVTVNPGNPLR